ncbi:MerR family transcriptional regulator [Inconstantimicrobium mannanitabidum]|uniref:MerR family transcriptional regulator n=1 Tax=Inconstantimicrobium mannanitabidum TaxID=1604901 RepID=A0ACB5RBM9_9CLOT|nr:MerR family transcriptional regulator [Clostridium sp. TW13]GKX66652.1 MerR family transcriptional regulator [Clostridium sp. TW13]
MKIGKFVEINNLTIDTIRHYMDKGLITPEKKGGQYDFDSKCQNDLDTVLELKTMGFSLNEIKSILLYKKLAKLINYEENQCIKTLFINKDKELETQINDLSIMQQNLRLKLHQISKIQASNKTTIGVNINTLHLLKCLKCGHDLELADGNIVKNQIANGNLVCSCGERYIIESGILKLTNKDLDYDIKFDMDYIMEYMNTTSNHFLNNLYKSVDWFNKKIDFATLNSKVILELGSGIGFFLRNIYESLPNDSLYIAVDHDINRHIFLKSILEASNCKKNILFICSDFLSIPIKNHCVDTIVDISGTTNYSFENKDFLLKLTNDYTKNDSDLIGSYILFKNFVSNSQIKDAFRNNFSLKHVKQQLSELDYNIIDENISNYIDEGGKYENFFENGEKIYSYLFLGKR